MIDWGNDTDASNHAIINFGWTYLPGAALVERNYAYNHFNADLGIMTGVGTVQQPDEYAGYVNVHSTSDGRTVIGGHNDQGTGMQTHLYWNFAPGFPFAGNPQSRIPDSVASYGTTPVQSVMWPKFAYQEGTDTVTHVIAQVSLYLQLLKINIWLCAMNLHLTLVHLILSYSILLLRLCTMVR